MNKLFLILFASMFLMASCQGCSFIKEKFCNCNKEPNQEQNQPQQEEEQQQQQNPSEPIPVNPQHS